MLKGSVKERLELAMGTDEHWRIGTDEEYIFKVLEHATDAEKRAVAGDEEFLANMRRWEVTTREYNRVLDLLRPSDESVEERVGATQQQIERESSWLMAGTTADWALRDEARELRVKLSRAKSDGSLTAAEEKSLLAAEADTRAALETYKQARNEMQDLAVQVITFAAGVIVTVLTAGAGGPAAAALIASNLVKSALVMAVTRVLATKVAKGDQFDVFGADGATAFGAGAIDGIMALAGPVGANRLTSSLLPSAVLVATEGGAQTFTTFGPRLLAGTIDGAMGGAAGGLYETIVQTSDMRARMEDKVLGVLAGTGTAAVQGAAVGAVKEAASTAKNALSGPGHGSGEPAPGGWTAEEEKAFEEAFSEHGPPAPAPSDGPVPPAGAGGHRHDSGGPEPELDDDLMGVYRELTGGEYGERSRPAGHGPDDFGADPWAESDGFDPEADAEYGVDGEHGAPEVLTNEPPRREGARDPRARTTDLLPDSGDHGAAQRGNVMDTVASWAYPHSEVQLDVAGTGEWVRLDGWDPAAAGGAGEMVSRKSGDAGQLATAGVEPLQEMVIKYKPGMIISRVPSAPGGLNGKYAGKPIFGRRVLEVPPQVAPIPDDVLDYAARNGVIIRDWHRNVYLDPFAAPVK